MKVHNQINSTNQLNPTIQPENKNDTSQQLGTSSSD
jgi:hypothetical protein